MRQLEMVSVKASAPGGGSNFGGIESVGWRMRTTLKAVEQSGVLHLGRHYHAS